MLLMLLVCTSLHTALFVVRVAKSLKSYIFRLIDHSGLTAIVSVKMMDLANQVKEGGVYLLTDSEHEFQCDTSVLTVLTILF